MLDNLAPPKHYSRARCAFTYSVVKQREIVGSQISGIAAVEAKPTQVQAYSML